MKLALMPREPAWWVWLVTVVMLGFGVSGYAAGFLAAISLSLAQTLFLLHRRGRVSDIGVQIRLGYTVLLVVCFIPQMRWLFWLPTVGTGALLVFGYCLMSRFLSLLPWNRPEKLSLDLLRRTFFSAPMVSRAMAVSACGGSNGVCELEWRAASGFPNPAQGHHPDENKIICTH